MLLNATGSLRVHGGICSKQVVLCSEQVVQFLDLHR
jgi:hypothetical protein